VSLPLRAVNELSDVVRHIISGFIIQYLGIRATFGISAIWFAILLPLCYFFVLETTFVRPKSAYSPGSVAEGSNEKSSDFSMDSKADSKTEVQQIELKRTDSEESDTPTPPKQSYRQRLRLLQGRYSNEPFLKLLFKPFPLFFFPAVLYSTIINGFHFVGMMAMGLLGVDIFSAAPYNLKPSQLGMIHIPNLVISFIFAPMSGFLADWVAKFLARRNKGIFEPEFRLWLMIIAVPLSTIAFVGYGWAVAERKPLWVVLCMSGLQSISVPFASQAALTYLLDCHPRDSNPAFVTVHFTKTLFLFIATTKIRGWLDISGPRTVFNVLALLNLLFSSLTIPYYIFGKRFRSYVSTLRSVDCSLANTCKVARSKLAQLVEAD
jgi:Major Facilitator Superfamily